MNRLQLVKSLRSKAGIAGTGPVTTIEQAGELGRLVDYTDEAWLDIQQLHNWRWMWEAATVTVTAGTNFTAGTIPDRRYDKTAFVGTADTDFLPWDLFRTTFREIQDGTPTTWTIRPDNAFVVDKKPTVNTAFSVERFKNPTAMTEDGDVPAMPEEHHMAIVYRALIKYADYEEAGALRAEAEEQYMKAIARAEETGLPEVRLGEALC